VGVNANLLAFEKAELWVPRIEEFSRCTGASIRLTYNNGEDYMAKDLIDDVGLNDQMVDDGSSQGGGAGIFDAYIVQAPWLPPVYKGLESLSEFIAMDDKYINFYDINQASRAAVTFDGSVRALPLDADYIALGWRQDVFDKYASQYEEMYGEPLKVPDTIEELVDVSEKLNGKFVSECFFSRLLFLTSLLHRQVRLQQRWHRRLGVLPDTADKLLPGLPGADFADPPSNVRCC